MPPAFAFRVGLVVDWQGLLLYNINQQEMSHGFPQKPCLSIIMSAWYARLGIYVEERPPSMPNRVTRWTDVQTIIS
jgi:hypothetical protein